MLQSPSIQFVYVDEGLLGEAWAFFAQHSDKTYSLTDCVSFAVMRRRGIDIALTIDRHFEQAGFRMEP